MFLSFSYLFKLCKGQFLSLLLPSQARKVTIFLMMIFLKKIHFYLSLQTLLQNKVSQYITKDYKVKKKTYLKLNISHIKFKLHKPK